VLRPLRYRRIWLALGFLGVAVMLVLSLAPNVGGPTFSGADKIEHTVGYIAMTSWFAALFERRGYWLLALLLLLLGIGVEFAQEWMSIGRMGDWRDVVANTIGIGLALLIASLRRESWLARVEKWLPAT